MSSCLLPCFFTCFSARECTRVVCFFSNALPRSSIVTASIAMASRRHSMVTPDTTAKSSTFAKRTADRIRSNAPSGLDSTIASFCQYHFILQHTLSFIFSISVIFYCYTLFTFLILRTARNLHLPINTSETDLGICDWHFKIDKSCNPIK